MERVLIVQLFVGHNTSTAIVVSGDATLGNNLFLSWLTLIFVFPIDERLAAYGSGVSQFGSPTSRATLEHMPVAEKAI